MLLVSILVANTLFFEARSRYYYTLQKGSAIDDCWTIPPRGRLFRATETTRSSEKERRDYYTSNTVINKSSQSSKTLITTTSLVTPLRRQTDGLLVECRRKQ